MPLLSEASIETSKPKSLTKRLSRAGMATVLGLGIQGCAGDTEPVRTESTSSSTNADKSTPEQDTDPATSGGGRNLGKTVLRAVGVCDSLSPDSKLAAKVSVEGIVVVDGRCDPDAESPVGVYRKPNQNGDSMAAVHNGDQLVADCIVDGQTIQNQASHATKEWVRIEVDGQTGHIPAVWAQGEEALERC